MHRNTARTLAFVACLICVTFAVLFPFCWLLLSSLRPREQLFTAGWSARALTAGNYTILFRDTQILQFFTNSMMVAAGVTVITVLASILAAYSLVFLNYRRRELFGKFILFAYMFPGVVVLVPVYRLMSFLQLTDTLAGVALVELVFTVPFAVWMLRGFFLDIPRELAEAANLDGCSKVQTLLYVVLPLTLPGTVAVAVFAFIFSWNEYLFPLVLINTETSKTLPLGVAGFLGSLYVDWGSLLAAGVVSVVPTLVLFIFLQRYLIQGMMAGAVKG